MSGTHLNKCNYKGFWHLIIPKKIKEVLLVFLVFINTGKNFGPRIQSSCTIIPNMQSHGARRGITSVQYSDFADKTGARAGWRKSSCTNFFISKSPLEIRSLTIRPTIIDQLGSVDGAGKNEEKSEANTRIS